MTTLTLIVVPPGSRQMLTAAWARPLVLFNIRSNILDVLPVILFSLVKLVADPTQMPTCNRDPTPLSELTALMTNVKLCTVSTSVVSRVLVSDSLSFIWLGHRIPLRPCGIRLSIHSLLLRWINGLKR